MDRVEEIALLKSNLEELESDLLHYTLAGKGALSDAEMATLKRQIEKGGHQLAVLLEGPGIEADDGEHSSVTFAIPAGEYSSAMEAAAAGIAASGKGQEIHVALGHKLVERDKSPPDVEMVAGKMGGQPCITGTRIPVAAILSAMSHGIGIEEMTVYFSRHLTEDQVRGALSWAAEAIERGPRAIDVAVEIQLGPEDDDDGG